MTSSSAPVLEQGIHGFFPSFRNEKRKIDNSTATYSDARPQFRSLAEALTFVRESLQVWRGQKTAFSDFVSDFVEPSDRSLLILALTIEILARNGNSADAILLEALRSTAGWPSGSTALLRQFTTRLRAALGTFDALPMHLAWQNAGRILNAAFDQGVMPTDIAPLYEGGIGIAWSNARVAAEAEANNIGELTFSFRDRGTSAEVHTINNDDDSVAEEIALVAARCAR